MFNDIFSEYEAEQIGIIFEGETTGTTMECIGSVEETLETKTVEKKCRGVVAKTRTRATGTGEVKPTLHVNYDIFCSMFGIDGTELKDGVVAYGQSSLHKVFIMTLKVIDEDGNVKYKAYPKCSVKEGISRKIENGADEVSEVELTVAIMPDEHNNGLYEAIESEITDAEVKSKWMTAFTPDLVRAAVV